MDQAPGKGRAGTHFHDLVVHVTQYARLGRQFHALGGVHIALQLAVEDHHRHLHFALDPALFGQGQHGAFAFFGDDLAVDAPFDVQPAAEDQVAMDRDLRADQAYRWDDRRDGSACS